MIPLHIVAKCRSLVEGKSIYHWESEKGRDEEEPAIGSIARRERKANRRATIASAKCERSTTSKETSLDRSGTHCGFPDPIKPSPTISDCTVPPRRKEGKRREILTGKPAQNYAGHAALHKYRIILIFIYIIF